MNPEAIPLDAVMTYRVATEQRAKLAALVGPEDWPAVSAEWEALDAAWAAATGAGHRRVLAADYLDAVALHREAYALLRAEVAMLDAYVAAAWQLATLAAQLGDEQGAAKLWGDALGSDRSRQLLDRYILEQGVGKSAYSVKLANVEIRFWRLTSTAASLLAAVTAYLDPDKSALVIATAILAAVGGLEAFVKEIPVDDAAVFLGLVAAGGEARQAALADIVAATNAARTARPDYLRAMDEAAVKDSLGNLYRLGSVAPVEGEMDVWRVVEEHGRV